MTRSVMLILPLILQIQVISISGFSSIHILKGSFISPRLKYSTSDISNLATKVSENINPKTLNIMSTKLISKYSNAGSIDTCIEVFNVLNSMNIADSYTHTALMTAYIK